MSSVRPVVCAVLRWSPVPLVYSINYKRKKKKRYSMCSIYLVHRGVRDVY